MMHGLLAALFLFVLAIPPAQASSTTYYVDYAAGSDSNPGTSRGSPWKTAPGMRGNSGVSATTTLNPGDRVIFKGCVTWPSSAFNWNPKFSGTAAAPIYYGVDNTWWDTGVSGCATAWNRPIFDAGGKSTPFQAMTHDPRMVFVGNHNYVTLDNIEFVNYYADGGGAGNTSKIAGGYLNYAQGGVGVHVKNVYVHGMISPFFAIGTGDVAAGSSTITNFVPFGYSPSPLSSSWTSSVPSGTGNGIMAGVYGYWAVQNSKPNVLSIANTGGNTWTIVTDSAAVSTPCHGCVVQIGLGSGPVAIAGNGGVCTDCVVESSVFDGTDGTAFKLNPYLDCGLSEGNNNWCGTEMSVAWRQPAIFRDNVIRGFCNGQVGDVSEWSGNSIDYWRPCTNPTAHTNIVESTEADPVNGVGLFYNNKGLHWSTQNPNAVNGRNTVGMPICVSATPGTAFYAFNNVLSDNLQNFLYERCSPNQGTFVHFNNTQDCGPSGNLSYGCANGINPGDVFKNDVFITTSPTPLAPAGVGDIAGNVTLAPQVAGAAGLSPNESYVYSPTSQSSPTVGKGVDMSAVCATVAAANSAAGAACMQDTTYGQAYDTSHHTAAGPSRSPVPRPSGKWDTGAYQFGGNAGTPQPPTSLIATIQ
jgi:hypothetical protein